MIIRRKHKLSWILTEKSKSWAKFIEMSTFVIWCNQFCIHYTYLTFKIPQESSDVNPFKPRFSRQEYDLLNYLMSISCLKYFNISVWSNSSCFCFFYFPLHQCSCCEGNCFLHPWPHLSRLLISNLCNTIIFANFKHRLGDMWNCQMLQ